MKSVPFAAPNRVGRPRSESSRRAILNGALELLRRDGYAALSIEGIARAAQVGKQTIYRWWPSKAAIVLDALRDSADREVVLGGGTRAERVEAFLKTTFQAITRSGGTGPVLRALMAEAQRDPAFARSFRESFIEVRRGALMTAIAGTPEQHDSFSSSVPPDVLVDLVFGVLWYRLLIGHAPLDAALAHHLAQVVSAVTSAEAR